MSQKKTYRNVILYGAYVSLSSHITKLLLLLLFFVIIVVVTIFSYFKLLTINFNFIFLKATVPQRKTFIGAMKTWHSILSICSRHLKPQAMIITATSTIATTVTMYTS